MQIISYFEESQGSEIVWNLLVPLEEWLRIIPVQYNETVDPLPNMRTKKFHQCKENVCLSWHVFFIRRTPRNEKNTDFWVGFWSISCWVSCGLRKSRRSTLKAFHFILDHNQPAYPLRERGFSLARVQPPVRGGAVFRVLAPERREALYLFRLDHPRPIGHLLSRALHFFIFLP